MVKTRPEALELPTALDKAECLSQPHRRDQGRQGHRLQGGPRRAPRGGPRALQVHQTGEDCVLKTQSFIFIIRSKSDLDIALELCCVGHMGLVTVFSEVPLGFSWQSSAQTSTVKTGINIQKSIKQTDIQG